MEKWYALVKERKSVPAEMCHTDRIHEDKLHCFLRCSSLYLLRWLPWLLSFRQFCHHHARIDPNSFENPGLWPELTAISVGDWRSMSWSLKINSVASAVFERRRTLLDR
jgi:hypothetical protein